MRGKSSSSRIKAMDMPSKSIEEPPLSGAYIRSLVKHLSSSRPKENPNPKSPNSILEDRTDEALPLRSSPPPPPQPKKQVRRRLHTSRPYQERLLNMAEARREIVAALKLHRASMKQANEQQQQALERNPNPNPNPNMYQENLPNFTRPSIPWSYPTHAPLLNIHDNLNIPLPNTPLGLNLNFQGFNNIDPLIIHPILPHSSSSSFSYSSPTICAMEPTLGVLDMNTNTGTRDARMHLAMDEREMEEIRCIGEKHDMEWNDTVNLVTSAWWSKFLDTMEVDAMEGANGFRAFDETVVDIPWWLKDGSVGDASGNASNILMQHLDDHYSQDASLPCLDIGGIEWLDGDWLS